MIKDLVRSLKNQEDERQTLSTLRKEIKEETAFNELYEYMEDSPELLVSLLSREDAKTRKNAALLMGDLGLDDFLAPLMDAYEAEEQLFVKSAYLTAVKNFHYSEYLPRLHERITLLSSIEVTPDTRKHIQEEIRALIELIILQEGITSHTCRQFSGPHDCILLTNKWFSQITADQITDGVLSPFPAGVRVMTENLEQLLAIRTYSELLFVISGMKTCPKEPLLAAKKIKNSYLLDTLEKDHDVPGPFYFRVELRSRMALDEKAKYSKKLSAELERLTKRQLINSPKDYEIELRFIENKEGSFNVLVKYLTITDKRFSYRKEYVAASIKPVNAALLSALAKPYMAEDAQVLDPFCGVGTMLIERQKAVKANTSFGIDIFEEAIKKARENTESAGQIVHYINRDFYDFTHDYLFDEIFTNMPFALGRTTHQDIFDIYRWFFHKAAEVLTPEGTIILYTHDKDYAVQFAEEAGYRLLTSFAITTKDKTDLLIFRLIK